MRFANRENLLGGTIAGLAASVMLVMASLGGDAMPTDQMAMMRTALACVPVAGLLSALTILLDLRRVIVFCGLVAIAMLASFLMAPTAGSFQDFALNCIPFWATIAAIAALTRRQLGSAPDFTQVGVLLRFVFCCVMLPLVFVSGFDLVLLSRQQPEIDWPQLIRAMTDAILGFVITVPAVTVLWRTEKTSFFHRPPAETAGLLLLAIGSSTAVLLQQEFATLFLLFPIVIAISFRLGPRWAAGVAIIISMVALGLTLARLGPLSAPGNDGRVLFQVFILAILYTALVSAGAVAEQARLRLGLQEKERQALDAANAKADFLATMSHELRTPLNSIYGFSQLVSEDGSLTGETRRRVALIAEASQSLLAVVNDILDYSKIEAGKIELVPQPFDLEPWLHTSADIVRDSIERKGLALKIAVTPGARGWYVGDNGRLRQILLNLLNNAAKFTAAGCVTVKVSVVKAETGPRLRFAVLDTGIGIPPARLERLFQRFSQVDGSISRTYGGTGLGLAISKRIVELMGGRIGVESTPGSGSEFWFEVPLPSCEPVVEPGKTAADGPVGGCILVVDDIAINREIARAMLEAAGCEVVEAASGSEAIGLVQAHAFDLAFIDVQMPDIDGLETTRRIRALSHPCARMPIVAITANILGGQIEACHAAGMDGHVGKPFHKADLIDAARRHGARSQRLAAPILSA
ncbi:MAG TPA: ATP-binding protein [Aliidongia sp.]|uniref:hybrid sensor histidine kinase/response regulator n=1 Tax=Aliidongia sp. TaxID=1914230 RepID=UPI002DDD65D2|nr:ATP-binding protein [Aliidongia sp.]HEV2677687.1 ATP-binding protein [Aliidongia sp.]